MPDIQPPLTGEALYNMLMSHIEPELMTDQLPLLGAKYASETPEQTKARAARYEKAFAEYDKQLAEYIGALKAKVHDFQNTARESVEHEARNKEEGDLTSIEDAIQKS